MVIKPTGTAGSKKSAILFPSIVNEPSDFGYVAYAEN